MNAHFSPRRFCRLLRAHLAESRRQYLGFLLMASVVDIILLLIFFNDASHAYAMFRYEAQVLWYAAGLVVTGSIFASIYFRHLGNPGAALISLMRPASAYEKCLQAILLVSVMYPLAYTVLYCLLNYPVVLLAGASYTPSADCTTNCAADFSFFFPLFTTGHLAQTDGELFGPPIKMQLFFLMGFWIVQALLLAGTAFFRQSAVLRTTLVLFLLWIGLLVHLPSPPIAFWHATPDDWSTYSTRELLLSALTWPGLLLLLWTTLLLHLREREAS